MILADSQPVTRIISGYSVYRLIYTIFCRAMLFTIWYFFFRKMAGKMKLPMKKMIMASVAGIRIEITSEQIRLFLNDAEVTIFLKCTG